MEKYIRNPDTMFEHIDDDTVVLNLSDGFYYGLNSAGRILWEALEVPQSKCELCGKLSEAFPDEDAGTLQSDVDDFLDSSLAPGLIEVEKPNI